MEDYTSGHTVGAFLLSATNPENGTVTYTYNGNNLLASKTDAKSQQLTYQYDTYNRLKSVTWANAPNAAIVLRTYYYDTNPLDSTGFSQNTLGRLTAVQYVPLPMSTNPYTPGPVSLVDMYSYIGPTTAGAGLPAAKRLQVKETVGWLNHQGIEQYFTGTDNLDSTYTYNNEGKVTAMTYPTTTPSYTTGVPNNVTGASYNYSYDSMYRLSGMTTSGSTTVVSGVSYNAANQLLGMTFNGVAETRGYNVLNQLTNVHDGSAVNLTYNYPTGTNNGKVSSMYNAVSGETVTYTYDTLNRIATAGGSGWGEGYTFDPFGNLTAKTVTSGSGPSMSTYVNESTNQISGSYDANGNGLFANATAYDVENHLSGAGWSNGAPVINYGYDAQNKRFLLYSGTKDSSGNPSGYSVVAYSPSGQKLGIYQIFTCSNSTSNQTALTICDSLTTSDQYFGGRRLASMDQLGSVGTFYPWGEAKGTTNPQDTWSYATYWRDSVSALDYANNRYYSNAYGRFMTPDPSRSAGGPSNPQSWNRYAYTTGDPVNRNDPAGLDYVACGEGLDGCTNEAFPDFDQDFQQTPCGASDPYCNSGPCTGADGQPSPSPFCQTGGPPPPPPPPPAPYLAALVLVGDCYDRSAAAVGQAGGAAVDDLTYEALDQYGRPYYGSATITETNTILSGNTTSINTSWTLAGGMFQDSISSGIQSSMQELESYSVAGSSIPLTINWFYGSQYSVLGVYATPTAVIINNTVPVNKNGTPHYCDQSDSIQNR